MTSTRSADRPPPTSPGPAGLTTEEALRRRERDGPNLLPQPPAPSPWRMLAHELTHLLAILLWVAAGLALLAGMPPLALAIVVIVVLNAAFAFAQEYRADRSTQRLRALLPANTRVVRDGRPTPVDVSELVVDDLVLLAAGDRVGADLAVCDARSLTLDESLVTGESGAVPRGTGDPLMAGTFVVQGEATAAVTAIGGATTLAAISDLTATAQRPPSPLTRQLGRVVRVIATIAAATGVALGTVAVLLGLGMTQAFLFGVGVAVALVPEGLLPTVTLSLARGAQVMAGRAALVRRLDAVETLGATTFICTDKTGTLTQNRMAAVAVVTDVGTVEIAGSGYEPDAEVSGPAAALARATEVAAAAVRCVAGRVVELDGTWHPEGDPMEAALHALALRLGRGDAAEETPATFPFTAERMLTSRLRDGTVSVLGAPEQVLARCQHVDPAVHDRLDELAHAGCRLLAVATRDWDGDPDPAMERDLVLLGLVALEDPPRPDVTESLDRCRAAGIRVAMITGDHPGTAAAIAREVGLLRPGGTVLDGPHLPADDAALGLALDHEGGVVVARVTPGDKLRIAKVLRDRGHVVAMTGDGVNDAPALREADVGVAMGASGSDVARESADLVLLDDHFATIVAAVELGRATFQNVRRFLTFHLTDNVAELAPFALWAMTGGSYPLVISVLQVLALDIGTDMLPALALGTEPPRANVMQGRHRRTLVDRAVMLRAFGVLGATEAVMSLAAGTVVLMAGGWTWGEEPGVALLALASGTVFAAIVLAQVANAFACRSTSVPVWGLSLRGNPRVVAAAATELVLLLVFLGLPALADLLGGSWPSLLGWAGAALTGVALVVVDGLVKKWGASRRHGA